MIHAQYMGTGFTEDLAKAVEEENPSNIRFFVAEGGNVDARDNRAMTLLQHAICERKYTSISTLLEQGADPNLKGGVSFYTPLHHAARMNDASIALQLIAHGANIEDIDTTTSEQTPLHQAAHMGALETARVLVEAGADLARKDGNGHTAFDIAMDRAASDWSPANKCFDDTAAYLEAMAKLPPEQRLKTAVKTPATSKTAAATPAPAEPQKRMPLILSLPACPEQFKLKPRAFKP